MDFLIKSYGTTKTRLLSDGFAVCTWPVILNFILDHLFKNFWENCSFLLHNLWTKFSLKF